jgi:hypothetical protein
MTSHEHIKPKTRSRHKSGADQTAQGQEREAPQMAGQLSEHDWHERAAFHVTFDCADDDAGQVHWQVHVYHEESDSRAVWPGMPGQAMVAWMCDRAGLTTPSLTGDPSADLQLAIGELRLDDAPIEQQAGGPNRTKRLRAKVDFQLAGPTAYLASTQQSRYVAHILACAPNSSATTILAADQQRLRPEALACTAVVEFDLPETGNYQLLAIILFPDDGAVGVALGPALSVIP